MTDKKTYTIPLRKGFMDRAPRKRTPRAITVLKNFLIRHCKVGEVKIGPHLNDAIWVRGIKNPPAKVTVEVIVEDSVAKVELQGKAYAVQKNVTKKEEASTLKDKITSKLGVKAPAQDSKEQEAVEEKKEEAKTVVKKVATTPSEAPKTATKKTD